MSIAGSSFRTGEPDLTKLLEQIHTGELQLPDFQREWVWDDRHIRSLLASISRSFPIGSVMLLETGGEGIRFKPRVVQGAADKDVRPRYLILDGQQRMTSLYLALRSGKPVPTRTDKGKDIDRLYYFDIAKCLDPESDREDAIISVPAERMVRTNFNRDIVLDLRTAEKEYDQMHFPASALFGDHYQWCRGYRAHHGFDSEKAQALDVFDKEIAEHFRKYRVPAIELTAATSKEAVCVVFEKVNTGGVSLTVFELVTATFAAEDFDLRKDWEERRERLTQHEVLQNIEATDFLQAVTLLTRFERFLSAGAPISCKRKEILNLTLAEYRKNAARIEDGLCKSARFLVREKIFTSNNLPYKSQLVPLSSICAVLGDRFEADSARRKLARWYWSGVFGELYGGTTDTRFARDIADVVNWIDGGEEEPKTVRDANIAPTRLLTLQSRQSAAYKGMMALLMKSGCLDFINGDRIELTTFFELAVDIHHIFPRKYCETHTLPRAKWNSIVNKAPLTARTNRKLGGDAPSKYLESIEGSKAAAEQRLDVILLSHLVEPGLLRADDFDEFICDRATKLLDLVEEAIGKAVVGRDAEDVISAFGRALHSTRQAAAAIVAAE